MSLISGIGKMDIADCNKLFYEREPVVFRPTGTSVLRLLIPYFELYFTMYLAISENHINIATKDHKLMDEHQ